MSCLFLLFLVLSLTRSYSTGSLHSNDTFLKKSGSGHLYTPYESFLPNFNVTGKRISEIKCREYIYLLKIELYVLGGRPANINEFPHMGAIGWKAKDTSVMWIFKCGCTLISEKFLLTAAHCSKLTSRNDFDVINRTPEIVRLGVTDMSDYKLRIQRTYTDRKIKRIIQNPKYAPPKRYYDIALIELYEEVEFTKSMHPACLWRYHDFNKLKNEVMVTGWGVTEQGHPSEILQVATVSLLETSLCEELLRPYRNRNWKGFQDNQICAGKLVGGVDTCQGDSGGPMQTKIQLKTKGKLYYVIGVTSFGMSCGSPNRPAIYTRVSSFVDWIEDVVWQRQNTL